MRNRTYLRLVLTLIFTALVFTACGRDRAAVPATPEAAPTDTPVAAAAEKATEPPPAASETATETPAAVAEEQEAATEEQPESPLSSPDSPLAGPESPLAGPESPLATPKPPLVIPVPEPQAGAGSVAGRLVSIETGQPLTSVVVRLAEILCPDEFDENADEAKMRDDCVFKLDNAFSPSAITDEDGVFIFENIDPNDYVLFVGDYMVKFTLVNNENGSPVIYTVEPDKVLQLDEIAVDF